MEANMMLHRKENSARLTRLATPQVERHRGTWLLTRSVEAPHWPADEWERLDRYLIFGSERDLDVVRGRIAADGPRVVRRLVELSAMERVVSNKTCLRALAMSLTLGNKATRIMAREAAAEVARTPDELRKLEQYVNTMRDARHGASQEFHRGGERGAVVRSVRPPRTSRLVS
jgi:60 kDa SS-A/Ro ribonucleoprotein